MMSCIATSVPNSVDAYVKVKYFQVFRLEFSSRLELNVGSNVDFGHELDPDTSIHCHSDSVLFIINAE